MVSSQCLPTAFLLSKDPAKISFFKKTLKGIYYLLHDEDTSSAIDWLKSTSIALIFLDFPSLDEPLFNLCQHIRKITQETNPPIFLITQIIKKKFTLEALQAGVTDFIHEPLEAADLHERIAVHFRYPDLQKKVKKLTNQIKKAPLIPQNTQTFLDRTLIRDKTLRTIIETKKIATPLSVFTIQLDSFLKLSKTLGEDRIIELIQEIEFLLKSRLRQQDLLITEGPGHYLMLLPKTSTTAAKIIAKEIQKEVSTTPLLTSSSEILVTLSIGVLSFEKELSTSAKSFEQFEFCLEKIKNSLVKTQKKGNIVISSE